MSTFKGTLNEDVFKGCVIDYFRGEVLNEGKAFFLSHFHTDDSWKTEYCVDEYWQSGNSCSFSDRSAPRVVQVNHHARPAIKVCLMRDHMAGLEDVAFCKILTEDSKSRLYCSNITKKMLLKKRRLLGIPADRIVVIEHSPIFVIPYDTAIRVTPLRAGHCPGSIMFLFEACDVTALYTGDFRLTKRDLTLCKPLHDPDTHEVIKIHSLYLDTTFANEDYAHFPSREKSKDCIIRVIRQRRTNFKYFIIAPTANTGIEYLMVELYKEFKCQIHASYDLGQNILSCIEHLRDVTTAELSQSFIHFCTKTGPCHPCPNNDSSIDKEKDVMTIKPSAQYFTVHALNHVGEVLNIKDNFVRVAYSSHSSLSELADFVSYLKPDKIHPSVVPKDMTADEVVQEITLYSRFNRKSP